MTDGRRTVSLDPAQLGARVVVVAPHPDDESIGCGGLIAILADRGIDINVLIVSDGSGSHPNSVSYPPATLAALRAHEAIQALAQLGVSETHLWFCHLRDRFVPAVHSPGFAAAVDEASTFFTRFRPETVVIPSLGDMHGDHRATAAIWRRVAQMATTPFRVLEYIVWPAADAAEHSPPALAVDISEVLTLKRKAIAAHRSQRGLVVTDDPTGFILPGNLLARADAPYEIFLEAIL